MLAEPKLCLFPIEPIVIERDLQKIRLFLAGTRHQCLPWKLFLDLLGKQGSESCKDESVLLPTSAGSTTFQHAVQTNH